jgi:nucleotide-binding universal stress UspA family protein
MPAQLEPRLVDGQASDLLAAVPATVDRGGAGSPSERSEPSAAAVELVLVRYEDTPRGLAALEHARVLADARGARLAVVAVAPHEVNQGGCAICRSTAGLYNRAMDEIAEEEIAAAATHVGVCDRVEFVVAKGGSFTRVIGELAVQRGARTVVLPAPRGGLLARLFGRDEAELTRRRSAAEVIVVDESS